MIQSFPSITKFQQFVELKDYRPPTKKEYVRYVRKCAEHFGCDPLSLSEDQLRAYFLFLRQEKRYTRSPMKAAKFSLRSFVECQFTRQPKTKHPVKIHRARSTHRSFEAPRSTSRAVLFTLGRSAQSYLWG